MGTDKKNVIHSHKYANAMFQKGICFECNTPMDNRKSTVAIDLKRVLYGIHPSSSFILVCFRIYGGKKDLWKKTIFFLNLETQSSNCIDIPARLLKI